VLKLNSIILLGLFLFSGTIHAQTITKTTTEVDDETYLFPINPGTPGSLAGTMGELRNTHFHSGLDIRTNNAIGFAVYASKSGYISRAAISNRGYGNVLYVTHPDGNTTVYAHLDKFVGPIAEHMLAEQYRKESFEIDIVLEKNKFPVKRGERIALSGNSGGSTGPHLHYEIRDRNNEALDPLKVAAFTEIADTYPPAPEKIALKTLDGNSRINDRYGRYEFHTTRVGNNHTIYNPILASGTIGIEVIAKDRMEAKSPFYGGVNDIQVWVDSVLVFKQSIDKIAFAETRYIYTLLDFKTMRNKGMRFYKLYQDDGNILKYYDQSPTNGYIHVNPNKLTHVRIDMADSYNNTSSISFKLKYSPPATFVTSLGSMAKEGAIQAELTENILALSANPERDSTALLYEDGSVVKLNPTYVGPNKKVYLVDLRQYLPDSIRIGTRLHTTTFKDRIPSAIDYTYYGDIANIQFPSNALFDTLYLQTNYTTDSTRQEFFHIDQSTTPLFQPISVTLKPKFTYSQKSHHIYRVVGKSYAFIGGTWSNRQISFKTNEFGTYTILSDTTPPTIAQVLLDQNSARFKIRDDLSGIASFEARINGEWLLMHYDSKRAMIWAERKNKNSKLKGNFELIVKDNAGNATTFTKIIP
jgi:hypothetical protein